ncbi:UV excision repair protein Rad23 [Basidiobolus meristosporus CBS 931.73]|uniref:UV excision repair protein RAD23 n=1 Tax=Basidiobolus meristosporus CBS 931.73 TaxID=1314790 RepID=A0A1Y1XWM5_9FUNG|nr:UV excision repair protein Rad23 [Basidiobolus meristosporus CBS 931.73]|eukprot:ORX90123.1 UV excision repair protein Rad23 [Basidiobolus meristosporus CBS 931.73]
MKLTIKTLQQKQFQIEVDLHDKVSTLKEKIEQSQGFPVAQQKLIFSGKILVDENLVSEYNATERDFMVVMVSKPKAQPVTSTEVPNTPAPPAAPIQTPQAPTRNVQRQVEENADDTPAPKPSNTQNESNIENELATGPEYEAAISHMLEMGFEREKITKAMRASFNNPDRAVEYLMNGIPEQTPQESAATMLRQPQNLFTAAAEQAAAMEDPDDDDDVDISFLTGQPQFQQLRQLVHQNPELLQPLLQQLGQANPELLQLINENQETFFQLLSAENDDMDDDEDYDPEESDMQFIQISQQEKEAIDRLVALGFDRETATEAYFACDKNEELAANYLFDNGF